jgi:hypothetical protein
MFETRLRPCRLRLGHRGVAEQRRHNLVRRAHVGINRINASQRRHSPIARSFFLVERRHLPRICLHQRHAFAVGRDHEQRAFQFRWRLR